MARKLKQTQIPWLGEIPEGWGVVRMRAIGTFSASGIDKMINDDESKVKIINYVDIYKNGTHILDDTIDYMVVTAPKDKIDKNLVKKGDLIFTPSSETIDEIGFSALVNCDLQNTAFSYHVLRFVFNQEVYHDYKRYLCNNHLVLNYFSSVCTGTIRQTLDRQDFKNCTIPIPPLDEQEAIAKFLDEKCARIDEVIAKKEEIINRSLEFKKSLIYEYVTGKKEVN